MWIRTPRMGALKVIVTDVESTSHWSDHEVAVNWSIRRQESLESRGPSPLSSSERYGGGDVHRQRRQQGLAVCSVKATMDPLLGIEVGDISGGRRYEDHGPAHSDDRGAARAKHRACPPRRPRREVLPAQRRCDSMSHALAPRVLIIAVQLRVTLKPKVHVAKRLKQSRFAASKGTNDLIELCKGI